MDEIKTDLFPENLRAARNDMGKQETGMAGIDQSASMKAENEYAGTAKTEDQNAGDEKSEDEYVETMTPAEPLPGPERPV